MTPQRTSKKVTANRGIVIAHSKGTQGIHTEVSPHKIKDFVGNTFSNTQTSLVEGSVKA
jgi:hypothetical protein